MVLTCCTLLYFLPTQSTGGLSTKIGVGIAVVGSIIVRGLAAASISAPWSVFKRSQTQQGVTFETTYTLTLTQTTYCASASGVSSQCASGSYADSDGLKSSVINSIKATSALSILVSVVGALAFAASTLVFLGEVGVSLGPLSAKRSWILLLVIALPLLASIFAAAALGLWANASGKFFDGSASSNGDSNNGLSSLGFSQTWTTGFIEIVAALVFAFFASSAALATRLRCNLSDY